MIAARSITEQIYRQLREELLSCRLRPGERLRTNELSVRFGVSLSGVREALSRLSAENLVVADPQRGFRVVPMSSGDLISLTEASVEIENLCVRHALACGDGRWEEGLIAARDRVLKTPPTRKSTAGRLSDDFLVKHHAFHDALVAACDNPWLLRMRRSCQLQGERYRQICIPLKPDLDQLHVGYKEIADAALARDTDLTCRFVAEQFQRNARRFVETLVAALEAGTPVAFWNDETPAATRRRVAAGAKVKD
jgi:DNA-binding GntR family transcriptional regulator